MYVKHVLGDSSGSDTRDIFLNITGILWYHYSLEIKLTLYCAHEHHQYSELPSYFSCWLITTIILLIFGLQHTTTHKCMINIDKLIQAL